MINGVYRVYKSGDLVVECPNIVTTAGKGLILRYLAGNVGVFAGAVAVGSGTTAAALGDRKLEFEYARGPVTLSAADVPSSIIVFKSSIPLETSGRIHELGMYPFLRHTDTEYAGQVFVGFDSTLEELSGGTPNTVNYRVGSDSYQVTAAASASTTAVAAATRGNFGGYSGADTFSLAYFINDANTASILVRLYVDATNYFSYTITPGTLTGYRVTDWNKSAFVATGAPIWDNINYADFTVTAGAAGATTVQLDGLRINDADVYPDYALVSRAVLAAPLTKLAGEQMDVEYVLEVPL